MTDCFDWVTKEKSFEEKGSLEMNLHSQNACKCILQLFASRMGNILNIRFEAEPLGKIYPIEEFEGRLKMILSIGVFAKMDRLHLEAEKIVSKTLRNVVFEDEKFESGILHGDASATSNSKW